MKVLIWAFFMIALSTILVLLKRTGIILGGLPQLFMFVGMTTMATGSCKLYDKVRGKKNNTTDEKNKGDE